MLGSMHGVIRHRLLVNYAADPEVVARLLPPPLRPQLVQGQAVVGICVLRLAELRPAPLPAWTGVRTNNAAHRIAVAWDTPTGPEAGVYVVRRDTGQRLSRWAGGRLFPGVHGHAQFVVREDHERLDVRYRTDDGVEVGITVSPLTAWASTLFDSPEDASDFFEAGSCGFSLDHHGCLGGIQMCADQWTAAPVSVEASSSWFEDPGRFPPGSISPDAALLMRDLPVVWNSIQPPAALPVAVRG